MALSSLSLAYGNVSFSAEAENENWLSQQLDKFLDLAKTLPQQVVITPVNASKPSSEAASDQKFSGTLASHLKAKGGRIKSDQAFPCYGRLAAVKGKRKAQYCAGYKSAR
jgi:hypothetical protein